MKQSRYYLKKILELQRSMSSLFDFTIDCGEFDLDSKMYSKPVNELIDNYTGKPFNEYDQKIIKKIRCYYILWRVPLIEEISSINSPESKKIKNDMVKSGVFLGLNSLEISITLEKDFGITMPASSIRKNENWVTSSRTKGLSSSINNCFSFSKDSGLIENEQLDIPENFLIA